MPVLYFLLFISVRSAMTGNGGDDQPGLASDGKVMLQQTGWRVTLFVEAQQITSRATAWDFCHQSNCCCKTENRTNSGRIAGWLNRGLARAVAMAGCFFLLIVLDLILFQWQLPSFPNPSVVAHRLETLSQEFGNALEWLESLL